MLWGPGDPGRGVDDDVPFCSPRYDRCWKLCCRESEWWDCPCICEGKSAAVGLEPGLFMGCIACNDGVLMFIESGGGYRDDELGAVM